MTVSTLVLYCFGFDHRPSTAFIQFFQIRAVLFCPDQQFLRFVVFLQWWQHMLEEITIDMTRCSQCIFDIRPFDDATVQHVLYTRLPIPTLSGIWEHSCISCCMFNTYVFVDEIVITKNKIIQRTYLINWRKIGMGSKF